MMDGFEHSASRPRRAAAHRAEQNLDELYQRFGKPLSDNEPDSKLGSGRKAGSTPATTKQNPKSKRWVPVKSDTPTKRRRQSSLSSSVLIPPTPVVEDGEDLRSPVKKRRGRPPNNAKQAEEGFDGVEKLVVTLPVVYTPEKAKAAAERPRQRTNGNQGSESLQKGNIERSAFLVAGAGVDRAGTQPVLGVSDEEPATAQDTRNLKTSHNDFQQEGKENLPAQRRQPVHSVQERTPFDVTVEKVAQVAADAEQVEKESTEGHQPDLSSFEELRAVRLDQSARTKAEGSLLRGPVQVLEELVSAAEEQSDNYAIGLPNQRVHPAGLRAASRSAVTLRGPPLQQDAGYSEEQIGAPHREHWSRSIPDSDYEPNSQRSTRREPSRDHDCARPLLPAPTSQPSYLNKFMDANPGGSIITTRDIDPHTGLVDYSDPRTWRTPTMVQQTHLRDALRSSTTHFQQITGSPPNLRLLPFEEGYNVAHDCLKAQLCMWAFMNPAQKTVPDLFKLERWQGGVEHWRYAPNCPEEHRPRPPQGTTAVAQVSVPCSQCRQDNVYCVEELTDHRQRCTACFRSGVFCDKDLARFRRFRLFI